MSEDHKLLLTLLTVDGKGKAAKAEALKRLLAYAYQQGHDDAKAGA
jgi:hypothetical protein